VCRDSEGSPFALAAAPAPDKWHPARSLLAQSATRGRSAPSHAMQQSGALT
jgi:hypothetical protein